MKTGGKSPEIIALETKLIDLAKSYQTFVADSTQAATSEFAPHQKAIAALMPKIVAANKGEQQVFTPEEQTTLKNAAAAASKLEFVSILFSAKSKETYATQLNNAKGIQTAAAKYAGADVANLTQKNLNFKNPNPLEDFYKKTIMPKYDNIYNTYIANISEYLKTENDKVATEENYLFFENTLIQWRNLDQEIIYHKIKNPNLYTQIDTATKLWAANIKNRQDSIQDRIKDVNENLKSHKKAVEETKSRFDSKLLRDNDAKVLSGNGDHYDDPEVIPKHYTRLDTNLSALTDENYVPSKNKKQLISDTDYRDFEDIPLVKDGMTAADVQQGEIGNCHLMATLSGVVSNPEYRDMLSKNIKQIQPNLYEVILYPRTLDKDGNPTKRSAKAVLVDTDFPVDRDGKVLYAQIKGDIWVAIVEKAYAKEFGGYDNIHEADTPMGAISALTNKEPKQFETQSIFKDKNIKAAFIEKISTKNPIMTFVTNPKPDGEKYPIIKFPDGQVLLLSHAYSFVSYSPKTGIIMLQNPHGDNHLKITFSQLKEYFAYVAFI